MTPNTRFYYHVGDAIGGWSAVYSLKTPPVVGELVTADRPLLIATYGDMGTVCGRSGACGVLLLTHVVAAHDVARCCTM